MKLDLTEEQELVRDTARRFLESEAPLSAIRAQFDTESGFTRDWWRRASELGWTLLGVPESLGGVPLSSNPSQDLAIVAEEMGRLVAPGPFQSTAVCLHGLVNTQDASRYAALLDGVTSAESIIAWAYAEPNNVWEPARFATKVERVGDEIVLNGVKAYVEAGAEADHFLVAATSNQGLVQLLVPRDCVGLSVQRCRSLDFVRRFAELSFDNLRLPKTAVLDFADATDTQLQRQKQLALLLQCAETNGAIDRAMEFTIEYMRERYAFGRAIASYQALKHRLADMYLHVHSCMAITDAALEAFDAKQNDSLLLTHVAKSYVASKSSTIMSDLVQLTGGIAVTFEHDLHLYSRRVAVNRAVLGTPEEYRYQVQQMIAV